MFSALSNLIGLISNQDKILISGSIFGLVDTLGQCSVS